MNSLLTKHSRITALFVFLAVVLTSCAQAVGIDPTVTAEPYGFFSGLWHGFIAPFSFFVSLFVEDVALYAFNNTGGWYDFGFVLGAGILFGGSRGRRKKRKKEK
ncbi:MAG: hypothetical protein RLN81_01245 [Balneolaceae bacterium]